MKNQTRLLRITIIVFMFTIIYAIKAIGENNNNNVTTELNIEHQVKSYQEDRFSKIEKEILDLKQQNKNNFDDLYLGLQVLLVLLQTGVIYLAFKSFKDNLKFNRREKQYLAFIDIEREITEKNKDVWGIPNDNKVQKEDGTILEIDIEKLSYMVRIIDLFAYEKGQQSKYDYAPLTKETCAVLFKMFCKEIYRDYWKYIVEEHFYYNSKFKHVINRTIDKITQNSDTDLCQ